MREAREEVSPAVQAVVQAGAVGLATAYELSCEERPETVKRLRRQRDRLKSSVLGTDGTELTGHPKQRLPGLLSIIARDTDGASVALSLDLEGIAASVGSACTTGMRSAISRYMSSASSGTRPLQAGQEEQVLDHTGHRR